MFNWTSELGKVLERKAHVDGMRLQKKTLERLEVTDFCEMVVLPVLEELKHEWEKHARRVQIYRQNNTIVLTVSHDDRIEFQYTIRASRRWRSKNLYGGPYRDSSGIRSADKVYTLEQIRASGKKDFAKHIIAQYKRWVAAR